MTRFMLRITQVGGGTSSTLRVEGALRGAWVEELRGALGNTPPALPVYLDLIDVTYADEAGIRLLHEALLGGARLSHCSPFLATALGMEDS